MTRCLQRAAVDGFSGSDNFALPHAAGRVHDHSCQLISGEIVAGEALMRPFRGNPSSNRAQPSSAGEEGPDDASLETRQGGRLIANQGRPNSR
jgi:hypothetical protein